MNKKPPNSKEPEYKVGDVLKFNTGDGGVVTGKIVVVYPTAVPSYKLESDDAPMPALYLSEPVLKKCLEQPSITTDNSPSI
jgi:hypothetical protein